MWRETVWQYQIKVTNTESLVQTNLHMSTSVYSHNSTMYQLFNMHTPITLVG